MGLRLSAFTIWKKFKGGVIMGEYAKLVNGGERVKLGSCEEMFYIRVEDIRKVEYAFNFTAYFRLPFPDEDSVCIGNYEPFNRGYKLKGFEAFETASSPGIVYLWRNEYRLNLTCYHGEIQPDGSNDITVEGTVLRKYELAYIKRVASGELSPVIRCLHCGKLWSCEWSEVIPFIADAELLKRIHHYAEIKSIN